MQQKVELEMNPRKMESGTSTVTANLPEPEFNVLQFEKKLTQLKDSQESINSLSAWCLEHRQHHKKIVNAWLNVLKKVRVDHRLTLFYLANDVIQYSKRKNYDFVESWGTTLQKATTMVREERVKNRILRIFKIWEQRGIYGEEFIADLSGLISASPAARRLEQEPSEFQPQYLISKIRSCANLEADTDLKLKNLKDRDLKVTDSESLCASLKDRRHVEDVEHEVEDGITLIEAYVNALKSEIKSRTHLISLLGQADVFYHTERGEVKVVATAYKNFGTRVKNLKKKLDELIPTLNSPVPSPDINAPSPEPDSELDLPQHETRTTSGVTVYSMTETYNAGYYNPAPPSQDPDDFSSNGFASFIGTDFNMQNFNSVNNMFPEQAHQNSFNMPAPTQDGSHHLNSHVQESVPPLASPIKMPYDYNPPPQTPLLPPPMPPFTSSGYVENPSYSEPTYVPTTNSYVNDAPYQPAVTTPYMVTSEIQTSYNPAPEAYNPEEEVETWEQEGNWDPATMETPESPPMFEKEGFSDPIEYDDSKNINPNLGKDVDHRVLILSPPVAKHTDKDHRNNRSNAKDVDHRNLISLVGGSPINEPTLEPPPVPPTLWQEPTDQDYRPSERDQDYRVPVDIAQQLKLPPPPPPPARTPIKSPVKKCVQDNVESIDMDLSDDDSNIPQDNYRPALPLLDHPMPNVSNKRGRFGKRMNMSHEMGLLEPPPPPPQNCDMNPNMENDNMYPPNMNQMQMGMPPDKFSNSHLPPLMNDMVGPGPPMPPMCDMPPMNWQGEFYDNRPPPEFQNNRLPEFQNNRLPEFQNNRLPEFQNRIPEFQNRFPPQNPNFMNRMKNDFRGGFRGRGGFNDHGEMFRGRGRGRGMWPRGPRGMNNNRGFRGGRGFRGQFRGGF